MAQRYSVDKRLSIATSRQWVICDSLTGREVSRHADRFGADDECCRLNNPDPATCEHDYAREPYSGPVLVYTCRKCGDGYEKDVS